jgi:hypothetical protein
MQGWVGKGAVLPETQRRQNTKGQTNINAAKQDGQVLYKRDLCILLAQFSYARGLPNAQAGTEL